MDTNFTKILHVLNDITIKHQQTLEELEKIRSNSVIINKSMAKTFIDDFDYVMQCVRNASSGNDIDWEEVVCELGFNPYNVIVEMKKQL